MRASRYLLSSVSAIAIICLNAIMSHSARADVAKAGTAATVKGPSVTGLVGTETNVIVVGKDIFADEIVNTDGASATQLMFLDQTNLTITPGSSVKIDKFVFDPNGKKGQVVFNVARGSMRFVTGSQDPTDYQIKTPVATIGVRGTIVDFVTTSQGLAVELEDGSAAVIGADGKLTPMNPATALAVFGPTGTVATTANGGLPKALAALLASSTNKATTAASLLVIAGNSKGPAADAAAADVAAAVAASGVSADALVAAISAAVITANDPGAAARAIVAVADTLPPDIAATTGAALAAVANVLAETDPAAANAIRIAIEGATNPGLINGAQGVLGKVNNPPPPPPPPPPPAVPPPSVSPK